MRLRKIVLKNDVASSKNVNLYQFFQKFRLKFCPNYFIFVWLSWKIRLVKAKNVFKNVLKFLYFAVFNRAIKNKSEDKELFFDSKSASTISKSATYGAHILSKH